MNKTKALLGRAVITYIDTFLALEFGAAVFQPSVSALQLAALGAIVPAVTVLRNGLALAFPEVIPNTLPDNLVGK